MSQITISPGAYYISKMCQMGQNLRYFCWYNFMLCFPVSGKFINKSRQSLARTYTEIMRTEISEHINFYKQRSDKAKCGAT